MSVHLAWSDELEAALAEPFPPEHVSQRNMPGGSRVSYVAWHRYVAKLNALVGGGWSMGTPITMHVQGKLVVALPVTILGTTRVNFGDEDDSEWETIVDTDTGEETEKRTMYGSPCTNAFAQAFKRTCALFGMGLDMYEKTKGKPTAKPAAAGAPAPAGSPAASFLDSVAPGKRAEGKTWRELLTTESGRGFVEWAVKEMRTLAPDARTALRDALEATKAGGGEVVKLEDLMNRAASLSLITVEQCARIEETIKTADVDHVALAVKWLNEKLAAGRLGA